MDFQHIGGQQRLDTHDTMAKQLFNGFVGKTEEFKAILRAEMRKEIAEFCLPEADMIQYTERWIDEIREERQIGYTDEKYIDDEDKGDKGATEYEMLEQMLAFLEEEDDPIIEMFGQINKHRHPTIIEDEDYGRLLDYPYLDGVAIYQKWMLDKITESGDYALHPTDAAFTARVLNMEVEEWMRNFVIEYLADKLKDTSAE